MQLLFFPPSQKKCQKYIQLCTVLVLVLAYSLSLSSHADATEVHVDTEFVALFFCATSDRRNDPVARAHRKKNSETNGDKKGEKERKEKCKHAKSCRGRGGRKEGRNHANTCCCSWEIICVPML